MLFQATPPDTSVYMITGYTVFFLILTIYILSLYIRTRNLNEDRATLNSIIKENRSTANPPDHNKPKARRTSTAGKARKAKKVTKKR